MHGSASDVLQEKEEEEGEGSGQNTETKTSISKGIGLGSDARQPLAAGSRFAPIWARLRCSTGPAGLQPRLEKQKGT